MAGMKVIDRVKGSGPVCSATDGRDFGTADYELRVLQEVIDGATPGLKRVEGMVAGLDNFRLMDEDSLILHLDDGRRLEFFLQDLDGPIAAKGGFYEL